MSTIPEKMAKQFDYQRTLHATSGNHGDLFVEVDYLTAYLAQQTRVETDHLRNRVKAELERLVAAGEVRRWTDVCGPSLREGRVDHYFLVADGARQALADLDKREDRR